MSRHPEEAAVEEVAAKMAELAGPAPELAMVLGSGLGPVADRVAVRSRAPFESLGLPGSTVAGHAGHLGVGLLEGRPVAVFSGRIHLYEGHAPAAVVRYVRAMHRWGVKRLLLTCSVGGIAPTLGPGELVLVTDHLNLQGRNPLTGPAFGVRFPDLGTAYDSGLRDALRRSGHRCGVHLHDGVLAAMPGPAYESPAEVRMLARLGADVVGMSTVPEVLAAVEIGLRAAVIAVVANRAAGLVAGPIRHEDVTAGAASASQRLASVVAGAIHEL